jgi:hypothetical protein
VGLHEQLDRTEEYPPQDLAKWITQQLDENQQTHWEQNASEMRHRKTHRTKSNDTSAMKRRDQMVISRLRIGYTRATHSIMNHLQNALFATRPRTTYYGHVREWKKRGIKAKSPVTYGKEGRRTWRNKLHM